MEGGQRSMAITRVGAQAVTIPLGTATRISTRLLDKREYVLVQIETDDATEAVQAYAVAP